VVGALDSLDLHKSGPDRGLSGLGTSAKESAAPVLANESASSLPGGPT